MRKLIGVIAFLLLVGRFEPTIVQAFQTVSTIACHHSNCQVRLADSGRLYVFQHLLGSQTLYISDPSVSQYTVYDLTDKDLGGVDLVDFVPLEAQNLIVFYTELGATSRAIKIYDLSTDQLQTVDVTNVGNLVSCNRWTQLNFIPPKFISHLGTSSEVVFCSIDSITHEVRINILNVLTQMVTQTIDMGSFMTLSGGDQPPWWTVVAGRDGNIYIETNVTPESPILASVLADAGGALNNHRLIFKFVPQTSTWSVDEVPWSYTYATVPIPVGEFEGVDSQGRYIFYLDWTFEAATKDKGTEVIRYDSTLMQVSRVSSSDIGNIRTFASMNAAGEVLLVTVVEDQGELSPLIVDLDNYVINPILTITVPPTDGITLVTPTVAAGSSGH